MKNLYLSWDFGANEPTKLGPSFVPLDSVVKDKATADEIREWYKEFSAAEIKLHDKNVVGKEMKAVMKEMKEKLVPWGEKLAKKIGAELIVDWGEPI